LARCTCSHSSPRSRITERCQRAENVYSKPCPAGAIRASRTPSKVKRPIMPRVVRSWRRRKASAEARCQASTGVGQRRRSWRDTKRDTGPRTPDERLRRPGPRPGTHSRLRRPDLRPWTRKDPTRPPPAARTSGPGPGSKPPAARVSSPGPGHSGMAAGLRRSTRHAPKATCRALAVKKGLVSDPSSTSTGARAAPTCA
jgi:hypothetical protein